jgi:hypothetical protein
MTIKLYFEALTKGMHAKMNSRYVPRKQAVGDKDRPSPPKVTTPKLSRTGFLGDAVIRTPYRER